MGVGDGALAKLMQLMAPMDVLDGLLQAESDKDSEDDGADVDEEIGPGVVGLMRRVDVDHGAFSEEWKVRVGLKRCWRAGCRLPCQRGTGRREGH